MIKQPKPSNGCTSTVRSLSKSTYLVPGLLLLFGNTVVANSKIPLEQKMSNIHLMSSTLQQQEIQGTVRDSNSRQPLAGVTVRIVGKTTATSTDDQGVFHIKAAPNDIIEVSYIGYQSSRVTVLSGSNNLNINLQPDAGSLEEVVVTGYGTQRRKDLTGSVAIVDVAQLKAQPASTAVEALQGKATGVQIVNDGAPGSTPQIKIRGYSTINNNEPLYVIDGVPFEGKLSWLNQNDIETMQVLKDASAASIYGSRANNGVIIITTKTGKLGKPQINLDVYGGIQAPQYDRYPKMMTPQQVYDMNNKLNGTNLQLPEYLLAGSKTAHEITPGDVDMSKYNYSRDQSTFYQITKANQQGTDWFKEVSRTAPTQSYQLSATGASDNVSYAMSGGYLNQKGTIIHSQFERFSTRSNTQFKAFDEKLRFGQNMQYSFTKGVGMGVNPNAAGGYMADESVIGWAYRAQTIIPVYDEGGNFAGTKGKDLGNARNPVAEAYRAKDNVNKSNFFFGNVFGEVDIIEGLTARTSFGLRYENWTGKTLTYPNPEFSEGSYTNNSMSERHGYNSEWTWTNTLNYNKKFDKHSLNVLAGTEAINGNNRDISGSRTGFFVLNSLDYFYLDAGTANFGNSGTGSVSSLFSLFGKADYSFDDRYILSATVRRDGSSNFGPNNKYGTFPGISGAWRLSSEQFMQSVSWIEDLKIRAGYGVTGNQRIPPYNYIARFASSVNQSSYPINGTVQSGLWQSDHANENVKWEQVNAFNIGLDFTLFQGDFDGAVDYYDKKTKDMLFRVPLPAAAAGRATSPYVNIGDMQNRGIEFSLGYHYGRRQQKDFTLDLNGTFSRNVNKVLALAPSISQQNYGNFRALQTTILKPGEVFGAFYGYQVAGIYQDANDIANSPKYADGQQRPGGLKYVDQNNDNVINGEDRTIIGNPHPDFVYSLSANAAYKNWDMAVFFYGSQGNDVFSATSYFTDFGVFNGARSTRLLDAWSPENTGSQMPSLTTKPSEYESATSSYYVQDGSFLKMKNLQIGYTVPVKDLFGQNSKLGKLRIYAGATNLFTITKYNGLDPEVTATPSDYAAIGVDLGVYPQSRQYLLGLSLGF